jgi:ferritin-like metal-binding protein YciE
VPSKNLKDLFIDELKDLYDAETRITKALPKMIQATNSEELSAALDEHLNLTQEHIQRLERVFEMVDESPARKTCKAIVGILDEGEELLKEDHTSPLRDAAIICAAQKVEHYEMATYGCLRTWADQLGEKQARSLLQQTLDEEGEADHTLTDIAMSLNQEAIGGDESRNRENEGEAVPVRRRTSNKPHGRSNT